MNKILMILAVVIAIAFAAIQMNKRQIAERLFVKALDERVAAGVNAEREDGIHVFVCGAGGPMPTIDAGPCIAVVAGAQSFIFDVGSGSPRKLGLTDFPMNTVDGIFLTHLHSDHIDSLGEMLLLAWITGSRDMPLPIYGPPGVAEVVNGFNGAYRIDRGFRVAHHGEAVANPAGHGGVAREIEPGVVYDQDGVKISVISVPHKPVEPAYRYRVDYKYAT